MARAPRLQFEDALYHITARGNERRPIFRAERDREKFLAVLERACARHEISLLGFVLMGNHFHLVAQTSRANLSRWMHWLLVCYTTWFNWRYERSGHLFQGRYQSWLVEEGEYLLALTRYVHLNPVRGKVLGQGNAAERRRRLRRYKWSSYPGTAGLARPYGFVQPGMILEEMGGPGRGRVVRYRRFVEEGLVREIADPWEAVRWQTVLGSESFVQRVQDRISEGREEGTARMAPVAAKKRLRPEALLRAVAERYQVPVERLRGKGGAYGLEARNVALWLIWERCGLSQKEIGELFGGMNGAAVAQRLRRLKEESRKAAEALWRDQMSNV